MLYFRHGKHRDPCSRLVLPGSSSRTTDQAAAKNFYTSLFGWTVTDFPMGPGQFYSMFYLDGRNTGAAYTLDPKNMPGVPPNWALYVAVDERGRCRRQSDRRAAGTSSADRSTSCEFGRMAVLQDPTGAVFCVWQAEEPSRALGIEHVPGHALLGRPEHARTRTRAKPFYEAVFGWQFDAGRARPLRLSAHQERRALHRRSAAGAASQSECAAALAALLPCGRRRRLDRQGEGARRAGLLRPDDDGEASAAGRWSPTRRARSSRCSSRWNVEMIGRVLLAALAVSAAFAQSPAELLTQPAIRAALDAVAAQRAARSSNCRSRSARSPRRRSTRRSAARS